MSAHVLGRTQLQVLQIVFRECGKAYGGSIFVALIDDETSVNLSQVYGILSKLQNKGFVTSKMSEPVPERGGRRKKLYTITGEGQLALSNALQNETSIAPNGGWIAV